MYTHSHTVCIYVPPLAHYFLMLHTHTHTYLFILAYVWFISAVCIKVGNICYEWNTFENIWDIQAEQCGIRYYA